MGIWVPRFLLLVYLTLPFSSARDGIIGSVLPAALPALALFSFEYIRNLFSRGKIGVNYAVVVSAASFLTTLYVIFTVIYVTNSTKFVNDVLASFVRTTFHFMSIFVMMYVSGFDDSRNEKELNKRFITAIRFVSLYGVVLSSYYLINVYRNISRLGALAALLDRSVGGAMELPWAASNIIAASLIAPLFLSWIGIVRDRTKWRLVSVSCFVLCLVSIFATISRNAFLVMSVIALMSVIMLFSVKRSIFIVLGYVLIFGALYYAIVYFIGQDAFARIVEVRSNSDNVSSFGGRAYVWKEYTQFISENPMSIVGFYGSLYVLGKSGHNLFLTAIVEVGYVGLIMYAIVYIMCLYASISYLLRAGRRVESVVVFSVLVGIFVGTMFEETLYHLPPILMLWTTFGLALNREALSNLHRARPRSALARA